MRFAVLLLVLLLVLLSGCMAGAGEGSIIAEADAHALACDAHECKTEGLCSLGPHGCIAANAADCRPSFACWDEGRCDAVDGRCVAQNAETW